VQDKLDLQWESFEYAIELRVNLKDLKISKITQELSKLEGKAYAIGESMSLLNNEFNLVQDDIAARIREADDALSRYGLTLADVENMTEEELLALNIDADTMEFLQEMPDLLYDNLNRLKDLKTQSEELFTEQID
jgi:hypothetical protein